MIKDAAYISKLEAAVVAMSEAGWLYHGVEGMSDEQELAYDAYLAIKNIRRITGGPDTCGYCGFALVVAGPRQCCPEGSKADGSGEQA